MDPTMPNLTIQEVSLKCGVPKSTLRFWEKRLGSLFAPIRSPGGQRRYLQSHLRLVERIKSLQEEGLSLEGVGLKLAHRMPQAEGQGSVSDLDRLAEKVAGMVKDEVARFLHAGYDEGRQEIQDRTMADHAHPPR
jgi:MerR family redox-sensitive transcriptional activator SoxR